MSVLEFFHTKGLDQPKNAPRLNEQRIRDHHVATVGDGDEPPVECGV